jgi:hypothetical protein
LSLESFRIPSHSAWLYDVTFPHRSIWSSIVQVAAPSTDRDSWHLYSWISMYFS